MQSVINSTPEVVAGATEVAIGLSSLDTTKATLVAVGTVGEAIKPFIPLIAAIVMKDLNFTMTIVNEEQRKIDQQALSEDIAEMTRNQIDSIHDIKKSNLPIPESIKANKIEPNELTEPLGGKASDRRGKEEPYTLRKCLKQSIDVACIPTTLQDDNSQKAQRVQAQLTILGKLRDSPNILKFYGLSYVDNRLVKKLRNANNQLYNMKCEVFSFGMLLWELAFEKIPYERWDMAKIKEYVLSNKREKITFGKENPDIQNLQKSYAKIIVSAWQDDPQIRASLQQIFLELHDLYTKYCAAGYNASPALKPDKTLDLDGTRAISVSDVGGLDLPDLDMEFSIDAIQEIIPLEDGIAAHKRKETNVAWECFNAHADLGNTTAKYWKGYYLWEGYAGQKDRVEASKLFKAAADDGLADAQLRYAFSLVGNPGTKFNKNVFIEYLTKAADNNNSTAQFNLGDLYIHGKLGVSKDELLGKKYLKLAALSSQPKAIEILQKLNINIYNDD
ncbi:5382_t:CDS:2 [Funneliformis mosseae]|uniref:5382_t:CDS:1 n=1 Tax=Funneliformis mosseae TaxID=27381 RepID=A0A9N9FBK9_FUNMO|nr:5382_t:CDS:2 [Funneliformis mosseae]